MSSGRHVTATAESEQTDWDGFSWGDSSWDSTDQSVDTETTVLSADPLSEALPESDVATTSTSTIQARTRLTVAAALTALTSSTPQASASVSATASPESLVVLSSPRVPRVGLVVTGGTVPIDGGPTDTLTAEPQTSTGSIGIPIEAFTDTRGSKPVTESLSDTSNVEVAASPVRSYTIATTTDDALTVVALDPQVENPRLASSFTSTNATGSLSVSPNPIIATPYTNTTARIIRLSPTSSTAEGTIESLTTSAPDIVSFSVTPSVPSVKLTSMSSSTTSSTTVSGAMGVTEAIPEIANPSSTSTSLGGRAVTATTSTPTSTGTSGESLVSSVESSTASLGVTTHLTASAREVSPSTSVGVETVATSGEVATHTAGSSLTVGVLATPMTVSSSETLGYSETESPSKVATGEVSSLPSSTRTTSLSLGARVNTIASGNLAGIYSKRTSYASTTPSTVGRGSRMQVELTHDAEPVSSAASTKTADANTTLDHPQEPLSTTSTPTQGTAFTDVSVPAFINDSVATGSTAGATLAYTMESQPVTTNTSTLMAGAASITVSPYTSLGVASGSVSDPYTESVVDASSPSQPISTVSGVADTQTVSSSTPVSVSSTPLTPSTEVSTTVKPTETIARTKRSSTTSDSGGAITVTDASSPILGSEITPRTPTVSLTSRSQSTSGTVISRSVSTSLTVASSPTTTTGGHVVATPETSVTSSAYRTAVSPTAVEGGMQIQVRVRPISATVSSSTATANTSSVGETGNPSMSLDSVSGTVTSSSDVGGFQTQSTADGVRGTGVTATSSVSGSTYSTAHAASPTTSIASNPSRIGAIASGSDSVGETSTLDTAHTTFSGASSSGASVYSQNTSAGSQVTSNAVTGVSEPLTSSTGGGVTSVEATTFGSGTSRALPEAISADAVGKTGTSIGETSATSDAYPLLNPSSPTIATVEGTTAGGAVPEPVIGTPTISGVDSSVEGTGDIIVAEGTGVGSPVYSTTLSGAMTSEVDVSSRSPQVGLTASVAVSKSGVTSTDSIATTSTVSTSFATAVEGTPRDSLGRPDYTARITDNNVTASVADATALTVTTGGTTVTQSVSTSVVEDVKLTVSSRTTGSSTETIQGEAYTETVVGGTSPVKSDTHGGRVTTATTVRAEPTPETVSSVTPTTDNSVTALGIPTSTSPTQIITGIGITIKSAVFPMEVASSPVRSDPYTETSATGDTLETEASPLHADTKIKATPEVQTVSAEPVLEESISQIFTGGEIASVDVETSGASRIIDLQVEPIDTVTTRTLLSTPHTRVGSGGESSFTVTPLVVDPVTALIASPSVTSVPVSWQRGFKRLSVRTQMAIDTSPGFMGTTSTEPHERLYNSVSLNAKTPTNETTILSRVFSELNVLHAPANDVVIPKPSNSVDIAPANDVLVLTSGSR